MFYNIIYSIFAHCNIVRYITFRSICAFLTAFFVVFLFMPRFISFLKSQQPEGQPIRDDGPQSHLINKVGIPTMGGVLIILSVLFCSIIWGSLTNKYLWLCIAVMLGFGAIGAFDDYKKLSKHDCHGISPRIKLSLQFLISCCCCALVVYDSSIDTALYFQFLRTGSLIWEYYCSFHGLFL